MDFFELAYMAKPFFCGMVAGAFIVVALFLSKIYNDL